MNVGNTGTPGDDVTSGLTPGGSCREVHRAVRSDGTFYEPDEPVEDVERAFARGRPVVTAAPALDRLDDLQACVEGALLRSLDGSFDLLAWRVATTDHWAVTGFESTWNSQHMLNVSEHWAYVTHVETRSDE